LTDRKRAFRGDRLRDIRARRGLTQSELAERTESSKNQIGRYEVGEADPSVDILVRLVNELGVTADWLIGTSDSEKGEQEGLSTIEAQFVQALRSSDAAGIIRIAATAIEQAQ